MKVMKRMAWVLFLVLAVAAAGSTSLVGSQRSTAEIMHRKLDASQRLLGALVLAQYDNIAELGHELDSLAEFQSWFVLPTPEYALYTREFRDAAKSMTAAATRKDVGAAFEAYTSMVGTCIQCHDYMD
jgi:cytochrome c553